MVLREATKAERLEEDASLAIAIAYSAAFWWALGLAIYRLF